MCEEKAELIKASWLPIEKAMKERNMTRYQLSNEADVNPATLFSWANGKYKPKVDKIKSVCDVLNLNYLDFI